MADLCVVGVIWWCFRAGLSVLIRQQTENFSSIYRNGCNRKCKSAIKPETVKLACRKTSGAAVAQDILSPHPEIQNRLSEEDKHLPTLPPRLYLEDEDFISQLHNNTMQNTAQEMAVCFQDHGNVIHTHKVPSPAVNENAIYQPLLPKRMVTKESSESSVYQPLTFGSTTDHREEKEKSMQSVTRNENSTYQPLTFKLKVLLQIGKIGGS